jgi:hypothetical protein
MALCTAMNTLVFSLVEYCLMMLVAVRRVAIRGRAASVVREGCSLPSDGMHDWGYIMIQEMPSTMNTGVDEVLSCGWLDDEGV